MDITLIPQHILGLNSTYQANSVNLKPDIGGMHIKT